MGEEGEVKRGAGPERGMKGREMWRKVGRNHGEKEKGDPGGEHSKFLQRLKEDRGLYLSSQLDRNQPSAISCRDV